MSGKSGSGAITGTLTLADVLLCEAAKLRSSRQQVDRSTVAAVPKSLEALYGIHHIVLIYFLRAHSNVTAVTTTRPLSNADLLFLRASELKLLQKFVELRRTEDLRERLLGVVVQGHGSELELLAAELGGVHRLAHGLETQALRLLKRDLVLVVLLEERSSTRVIGANACRFPSRVVSRGI